MTPYIDPREQLVVEVFVRDLARSVAFYQALAFELLDEKAGFATLGWEGCRIFLDERPDAPRPGHPQANVRVMVADIHAAWQRAQALGAPILTELADRGYGLLDFTVLDPDGFGVRFGTRVES
jgi:catechol 2,3-dioxygenase-like lactoylglutathione lyase family enzyme